MPDMRINGSASSYSPTYFPSQMKTDKNGETSNLQKGEAPEALKGMGIKQDSKAEVGTGPGAELSEADQTTIQQMKAIENEVIAHEQAHKSAGGSLAGAASYSYTLGPDGKRYISGGEVSLRTPATDNKEIRVRLLEQVKQAALAPAQPSGQDIQVAAGANAEQLQLNAAIQREKALKAYGGNKTDPSTEKEKPVETSSTGVKKKNEKGLGQYFDQVG